MSEQEHDQNNGQELTQDELASWKAKADLMGVQYHPSIGLEKLKEKVKAHLDGTTPPTPPEPETPPAASVEAPVVKETENQRIKRLRLEALKMVRIRVTCMNPMKKEWEGEIITTGNSLIGTVKKYVPFNADEGWHVPQILLEVLQNRQCQVFTTSKTKNGVSIRQGKLIKEFAIEILPSLTEQELKELAQRQAMAAGAPV